MEVDWAQLLLCNVYIPAAPDFNSLFSYPWDILIMGDFKAHDASWYSFILDEKAANRGAQIINTLDNSMLMVINQDFPTRTASSSGPSSSPEQTRILT